MPSTSPVPLLFPVFDCLIFCNCKRNTCSFDFLKFFFSNTEICKVKSKFPSLPLTTSSCQRWSSLLLVSSQTSLYSCKHIHTKRCFSLFKGAMEMVIRGHWLDVEQLHCGLTIDPRVNDVPKRAPSQPRVTSCGLEWIRFVDLEVVC